MTPLPGGFDPTARIENAGSVRLTQSGLGFLEANLGPLAKTLIGGNGSGGMITFPVPATSGSQLGIRLRRLPRRRRPEREPAEVRRRRSTSATRSSTSTRRTRTTSTSRARCRCGSRICRSTSSTCSSPTARPRASTATGCPSDPQAFANIDLDVDISIEVDRTRRTRAYGYSRVKINKLDINQDAAQERASTSAAAGSSNFILEHAEGRALRPARTTRSSARCRTRSSSQLCQQANPALEPDLPHRHERRERRLSLRHGGRRRVRLDHPRHRRPHRTSAACSRASRPARRAASTSSSPSAARANATTTRGFAWGDLNPIGGGATLGHVRRRGAHADLEVREVLRHALARGHPDPGRAHRATRSRDWPAGLDGPHVGIALSERFANYALNGIYNSGLLCLGISTETVPLLNSGTLGLLASSLKDARPAAEAQQVALVVRPSKPPSRHVRQRHEPRDRSAAPREAARKPRSTSTSGRSIASSAS